MLEDHRLRGRLELRGMGMLREAEPRRRRAHVALGAPVERILAPIGQDA
jgi:hypothetical protein